MTPAVWRRIDREAMFYWRLAFIAMFVFAAIGHHGYTVACVIADVTLCVVVIVAAQFVDG